MTCAADPNGPGPEPPPDLLAYPVPTQLIARNWEVGLALHPDREAVRIALDGIRQGAKILYAGPTKGRRSENLKSAHDHAEAVSADIAKEVKAGRMAGPFPTAPATPFIASPIGTVPKKGTDEVRRIHHLSHPSGESVNDYVEDVQLSYASFDVSVPRHTATHTTRTNITGHARTDRGENGAQTRKKLAVREGRC